MKFISSILTSAYFKDYPPVLVDIGASGTIHPKWKSIARHSICVAFDADDREFRMNQEEGSAYRRLITFNRIVTSQPEKLATFYLTASPFCSSLLRPKEETLSKWVFGDLFRIEKKIELSAITIHEALGAAGLTYIDWFKTDTQGTDLRLFNSLPEQLSHNILAAEFEPGILDAYEGEDKLHEVMKKMEEKQFWLSTMDVKGIQRLNKNYVRKVGSLYAKRIIRKSPGWAELTYLRKPISLSARQYLLLFVFAVVEQQFGFALEVLDEADVNYNDAIFRDCRRAVLATIQRNRWKVPFVVLKRQINKLFSDIND
jgi:hypothetical protein